MYCGCAGPASECQIAAAVHTTGPKYRKRTCNQSDTRKALLDSAGLMNMDATSEPGGRSPGTFLARATVTRLANGSRLIVSNMNRPPRRKMRATCCKTAPILNTCFSTSTQATASNASSGGQRLTRAYHAGNCKAGRLGMGNRNSLGSAVNGRSQSHLAAPALAATLSPLQPKFRTRALGHCMKL